jgi:hypothetical protein
VTSTLVMLAELSRGFLSQVGIDVGREDAAVLHVSGCIEVVEGCDCIQPWILFVSAVIALRAPWGKKICGLVAGTAAF